MIKKINNRKWTNQRSSVEALSALNAIDKVVEEMYFTLRKIRHDTIKDILIKRYNGDVYVYIQYGYFHLYIEDEKIVLKAHRGQRMFLSVEKMEEVIDLLADGKTYRLSKDGGFINAPLFIYDGDIEGYMKNKIK